VLKGGSTFRKAGRVEEKKELSLIREIRETVQVGEKRVQNPLPKGGAGGILEKDISSKKTHKERDSLILLLRPGEKKKGGGGLEG